MRTLARLCHHCWVLPVVVHLGRGRGGRFAVLQQRLQVARTTIERALAAADELDLVMKNPGHGHPLRPEYVLTPRGETLAPACERVVVAANDLPVPELLHRKWTLPILASLKGGTEHFSELERDLTSCSPRALANALIQLEAAGWVRRDLMDERPPRPCYHVTQQAESLAQAACALALAAR